MVSLLHSHSKEAFLRHDSTKTWRKVNHFLKTSTMLYLSIVLFSGANFLHAKEEIRAKSGTRNDIQEAINQAPEGATVIIPEGNHNISGSKIQVRKNITIAGSGSNQTTLKKQSGLDWIFQIVNNGFVRFTNLIFDGNKSGGGIRFSSSDSLSVQVDNSLFSNFNNRAIETNGNITGVIKDNKFNENGRTDIVVYGENDKAWNKGAELGQDNALFIENNTFTHQNVKGANHSISSNHGSRYVFRNNTIKDGNLNTTPIDAHGNFEYGRGSRTYEIYNNDISSEHSFQGIYIRGGTGVIYDNTFKGDFTHPIVFTDYRSFNKDKSGGYHARSYPAIDQIRDVNLWNNTYQNKETEPFIQDRGLVKQHVQKNRDYFMTPKKDYKAYSYPHSDIEMMQNKNENSDIIKAPGSMKSFYEFLTGAFLS
jgi:hypothetical protein